MTTKSMSRSQPVKVIGTLVAPGEFRWEIPTQSASPEARKIVELLRTSYMSQETDEAHTSQFPTCQTKVV